jgi:ribonuclease-3
MIKDLENAIGYRFKNITLLQNALAHSSYANERWHDSLKSNERLEFLGDSILGMVVAEYLYRNFPDRPEGDLTRMRADMVCERSLAMIAERIGLGEHLLLGNGEETGGGRTRDSILADAVESVIAACFLDGGMEPARKFIDTFVLTDVPVRKLRNADYKTALQELVQQKKNQVLSYALVEESGPDHDKHFVVQVSLNGTVVGIGDGRSKKKAEQAAAHAAIEALFPDEI